MVNPMFRDPTYVKSEIEANRVWRVAFWLSEYLNDNAPIGWGRYISMAESLLGEMAVWDKPEVFHDPKKCPEGFRGCQRCK